jgi:outer membrane receptor for ferrienterochelin and colicin
MRLTVGPLAVALLGFVGTNGAYAQDSDTVLNPIIVSGKSDRLCIPAGQKRAEDDRRPLCVGEGIARNNVPGDTFDRNQLDRLPAGSQAQDFVKRLPGVMTGGAPGEDKDARVLGMDKEYTRTSIDGVILPDGGEKREFNLDSLPAGLVDSVEVIRGRRADMEADGLAGRIDVKLADIPETPRYEAHSAIGGSSDGQTLFDLGILGGGMYSDDFGAQGGLTRARNSNSKTKEKFTSSGLLSEAEDENKSMNTFGALADILWQNDANAFHLKPLLLGLDEDKDKIKYKYKANGTSNGTETEVEEKEKRTYGASGSWRHDFDSWVGASVEMLAGHYRTTEKKDKGKRIFTAAGVETTNKYETEIEDKLDRVTFAQVDVLLPFELGGIQHDVKTGTLLRVRDRTKDKQKTVGGVVQLQEAKEVYAIDETVWAGYVLDEIDFGNGLTIAPGVRFEASDLDAAIADGTSGGGNVFDILPSLPVHFQATDDWSIDASVARLVNRPKFDNLIPQQSNTLLGNPDLDPERAWAFDTSVTYETDDLELSFGLFHRAIEDLMETVDTGRLNSDGDSIYQYQNVGNGWTNGIILSQRVSLAALNAPVLNGFSIFATQTFARSKVTEADGTTREFKEQAPFFADLAVEWTDPSDRLSLSAGLGYTAKIDSAGDSANESRDAELSLDLAMNYQLTETFELYALAKNVTGTERVTHKSDGTTEIQEGVKSYFAGIRAKF